MPSEYPIVAHGHNYIYVMSGNPLDNHIERYRMGKYGK
jgi:hypothetical protein